MGQHWSHLTPTKRIQLDAFIRAGMKPTDIAKELGVHHTTIYRELNPCGFSTARLFLMATPHNSHLTA
ncbi:MAG: helix-turn-helix domain-containing protein [Gemmiger qucibialis]